MEAKKVCLENLDGNSVPEENKECGLHENLTSFTNIKFDRVLNQLDDQKTIFLTGDVDGSQEKCVLILEKKPFDAKALEKIISERTTLEKIFHNDIYGLYDGFLKPELNSMKVTLIHPATERHIKKYSAQDCRLLVETPDVYKDVVLPHIKEQQFSLQWVYNILEHKAEVERIMLEDPDDELGFILSPDLKWDGKNLDQLYMLVICRRRDLHSLRDLNQKHLPLLKNIRQKTLDLLKEKFGLSADQIRMYVHYQPSYYHFHVHVTALKYEAPGIQCTRAHLLETVLSNIEIMNDYYAKATLTYVLKETDTLYSKAKELKLIT